MKEKETGRGVDFAALVERVLSGEEDAFDELYLRSVPRVTAKARKYLHNPEDVEDAVQETYLRAYKNLRSLENPERFVGWAIRICANVCNDRLEAMGKRQENEVLRPVQTTPEDPGLDLTPADEYRKDLNPSIYMDAAHVSDTVEAVLAELPENQKACLYLWMSNYKTKEIAEALDMNPSTVSTNVSYAKKKVKKSLEKMRREGTFDYKAVHADPLTAFLWLFAEYEGYSRAVPAATSAALAALKAALAIGGSAAVVGAASATASASGASATSTASTAKTGLSATLRRLLRDPMTSIVAILLAVALAIGTAVGIQARSSQTPAEKQEQQTTTRPAATRRADNIETPEQTTSPVAVTGPGGPNAPAPVAATPTPGGTGTNQGTGGGAGGGGGANPQIANNIVRADGRLNAFRTTDADSVTPNAVANAEQTLTNGLTQLTNNYASFPMTFDNLVKDADMGLFTVNLFFGNYTGYPAKLLEIKDVRVRDKDGNLIAKTATFVPSPITVTPSGEEFRLKLSFPDSYVNKQYLPTLKSDGTYEDTGVEVFGRMNYVITGDIEEFPAKEISGLPELTKPYPQEYPGQKDLKVYVRDMVQEGNNILCYMGVRNDTKATVKVDRFEYLRFYGVDDKTRAVGRVHMPSGFVLKPGAERYLLLTIPASSYDNFSLLNSIGHTEDVIYDFV